jgi:hypothetical protein
VAGCSAREGTRGQAATERRSGHAAGRREERREGEGKEKKKEKWKKKGKEEKEKRKRKRERRRAHTGGIRGGCCDLVGHEQRLVRARIRPQGKGRGLEIGRLEQRDFGKWDSGFRRILSSTMRNFANNYFSSLFNID